MVRELRQKETASAKQADHGDIDMETLTVTNFLTIPSMIFQLHSMRLWDMIVEVMFPIRVRLMSVRRCLFQSALISRLSLQSPYCW